MLQNKPFKIIFIIIMILLFTVIIVGPSIFEAEESIIIPEEELGKRYTEEELLADLDYLMKTLEEVHPNLYAFISEEEFRSELELAKSMFDEPASRVDFYKRVAPIISMLGDGHTGIQPPREEMEYALNDGAALFPLSLSIIDGRAFIVETEALAETGILPGSELLSINERETEKIIFLFMEYISGEKKSFKEKIVERQFGHLLWLLYGFEDTFMLETACPESGEITTRKIKGLTDDQMPRVVQDKEPYTFTLVPGEDAGLITIRSFVDLPAFEKFLEDVFQRLKTYDISHLIIDVRENGGGNSQLGDALLQYLTGTPFTQFKAIDLKVSDPVKNRYGPGGLYLHLQALKAGGLTQEGSVLHLPVDLVPPDHNPLRFDGQVYLLVGPYTFSSAASFAAAVQYYNIGILIGEETGGLLATYGDVYRFTLPHTKLQVGVSHKRFVSPGGKEGQLSGVMPHYEVSQVVEDLSAGKDAVMDFALEHIQSPPNEDEL